MVVSNFLLMIDLNVDYICSKYFPVVTLSHFCNKDNIKNSNQAESLEIDL